MSSSCIRVSAVVVLAAGIAGSAAEIPKAPVPPSPYLPIIYKFADAMLERGRDTNGLFLSALDRGTLNPLTNRPSGPTGVREEDRVGAKSGPLMGSNPQHDQNLLRLLYTLSELSGKPKYREAADAELRWFAENAASLATNEMFRPWMLWDRAFEVAPEPSRRLALSLFNHQLDSQTALAFNRHAGFYIRAWAVAYAHTKHEPFLNAIDLLLTQLQKDRRSVSAASALSLAIDCDAAARLVSKALASRLRALVDREDEMFSALAHELKSTGGFGVDAERRTSAWSAGYGSNTTAQIAMMCVSRYENTGKIGYRELIHAAADVYLDLLPADGTDAWSATFGHAISLELAAWRSTARQVYLDRARQLADFAVKNFLDQGPLPRASMKTQHYESITGADTLALALVELHLHILHITAVRCPPNTIDR